MNSVYTFPSIVERANLPRGYYGGTIQPQYNQYVSTTPFHSEQMEQARKRVNDFARIDKKNSLNYSVGGIRNLLPKPQPAGSFQMPLTTSGNQIYHTANALSGRGGTFRTREGQQYGLNILQQRAKQLQELELLKEEGMPISELEREPQPIPLDKLSEDKVALDLLLNEINSFVITGRYTDLNTGDVRKAFGLIRKILLDLSLGELKEYYEFIGNILDILDNIGSGERVINRVIYNTISRMYSLIRVAIASINKAPKERKSFINTFTRTITKLPKGMASFGLGATNELFENQINDALEKLEKMKDISDIQPTEGRVSQPTITIRPRRRRQQETQEEEQVEDELEGNGAFNMGTSRIQQLYGGSALNVDEDGEGIRNDGMNDHRFSSNISDTQTRFYF